MTATNFHDDFLPQDSAEDDSSIEAITSQPLSEAEIEELLYGGERSSRERLELLRSLRADLADRESNDFGERDAEAIVAEIDSRIAELTGAERDGEEAGAIDPDPLAHRETLSPDSDELDDLEAADDDSLDDDVGWDNAEDPAGSDETRH
jgi:hypothetical protein